MAREIRVGWVGVRGWGRRFWDAVKDSPLCRVGGCFHPDAAVAAEAAGRMGGTAHSTLDGLLAADIDAVLVLAPNPAHFELAGACLRAGKHVLVEKPLANTSAQAAELVRLAAERSLLLGVGHNYRRSGFVREMKKALDSGRIGRPVAAELHMGHGGAMRFKPEQWRFHREKCPGGPLNMLGTHLIDAANYLFGVPVSVGGRVQRLAAPTTAEDASVIRVDYEGGVCASIVNLYSSVSTESICVYGTEGALRYSRWPECGLWLQGKDVGFEAAPLERLGFEQVNTAKSVFEEFVGAVRDGGPLETDGRAGAEVVRVMEAALESSRSDKTVSLSRAEGVPA